MEDEMSNEQEWGEWLEDDDSHVYRNGAAGGLEYMTAAYANRLEALAALADEEWGGPHNWDSLNCRYCGVIGREHATSCRKGRYDAIKAEQEG